MAVVIAYHEPGKDEIANKSREFEIVSPSKPLPVTIVSGTSSAPSAVSVIPEPTPSGYNRIDQIYTSGIGGNTTVDTTYTITNGKEIDLRQFIAGSEQRSRGSQISLYYAPNGSIDGSAVLLTTALLDGQTFSDTIYGNYTGDGTAALVMRRRTIGSGVREVFGRFLAFEEI